MKYVALLRGIGPGNPNMHQAKLKEFFESLGFENVIPVISSGNIVFETFSNDAKKLEDIVEKALPEKLGFSRTTIIRSQKDLKDFVSKDPYEGVADEKPNYLLVTFFKDRREVLASVIQIGETGSTKFMADLEKKYGKEITSRTWKTIHRILAAMDK